MDIGNAISAQVQRNKHDANIVCVVIPEGVIRMTIENPCDIEGYFQ